MFLPLLDMSSEDFFGGEEETLGLSGLVFGGRALGDRVGFEVQVDRARRLKIYSSCLSSGDVLIRHLTVAPS